MRTCNDYEILIHLYLDGMLEPSESHELSAHLASCSACRKRFEQYRQMKEAMAALKDEPVPADLHDSILSYVTERADTPAERRPVKAKRFPSWTWKTAAGIAACAVIAFTAVHMMPRKGSADQNALAARAPMSDSSCAEEAKLSNTGDPYKMPTPCPEDTPEEPAENSGFNQKGYRTESFDPKNFAILTETVKSGVLRDASLVNGYLAVGEEDALPPWIDREALSSIDETPDAGYARVAADQEEEWVSALEESGFALYSLEVGGEASEPQSAASGETDGAEENVLFLFQWEKTE